MPVPKLSGELTREQIIEKYAELPYNWHKKITFDWVEVNQRNGSIIKNTYEFNADSIPCGNGECAVHQLSFVTLTKSGVVWTCATCRKTEGPLPFEKGRLVKRQTIDLVDAWKIINETGQKVPLGLPPLSGRETFRIV